MVARYVILDTGPLGLVTNPILSAISQSCTRWLQSLLRYGVRVIVPEIADDEIRRELLRAKKFRGLARLDSLGESLDYLPLETAVLRQAAEFWAAARQQGRQTAPDKALDADVILAAQAHCLNSDDVTIATTNVRHLSRYVRAEHWQDIDAG